MQLPFLLLGCSVRERTPLLLLQQEFDNAFLFLSLPAVAYAVCAVAATDGGAGKADTVDWHPNSSNKMLALPGLLCYYPGCVYQSWLALQLFGRFMSFPPQAPRMPAARGRCARPLALLARNDYTVGLCLGSSRVCRSRGAGSSMRSSDLRSMRLRSHNGLLLLPRKA